MSHVFISYSSKDRVYARQLAARLLAEGFDVWIDNQRLRRSEDWWRAISLAVRGCDAVVVILTPNSDNSKWVQREITLAERYNKPLFPLWLDGDIETPNWDIFVRTQIEDVRSGELPPDEFYDHVGEFAPRRATHGVDITQPLQPPKPAPVPEPEATPPQIELPPTAPETTPPQIDIPIEEPEAAPPEIDLPPTEPESAPPEIELPPDEPEVAPPEEDAPDDAPLEAPDAAPPREEIQLPESESASAAPRVEPMANPVPVAAPERADFEQTQPVQTARRYDSSQAQASAYEADLRYAPPPASRPRGNRNLVIGAGIAAALLVIVLLASSLNPSGGAPTLTPTVALAALPTRTPFGDVATGQFPTASQAFGAQTPTSYPAPGAYFEAESNIGQTPLRVEFNNRSTGNITRFQWDFGDGSTSEEMNPTHEFNAAGTYFVTLTVSGPGGSSTFNTEIRVQVGSPTASAQPGFECTYMMRAGDTLLSIATDHGITMQALATANSLTTGDIVYVGQFVYVPCATSTAANAASSLAADSVIAQITSERQNVRSGPGTQYDVIGQLQQGENAFVIGTNVDFTWVVIDFRGQQGWLATSLLTVVGNLTILPVIAPPPTPTPLPTIPTVSASLLPSETPSPTSTTTTMITSANTPLRADNVQLGMVIEDTCEWLSADGRYAVTTNGSVYQLADRRNIAQGVPGTLLSPDGRWIAYPINGAYETLVDGNLWAGARFDIDGEPHAFSPDGRLLVSGNTVYSTETGLALYNFDGLENVYGTPTFGPDGQLLVLGSNVVTANTGEPRYYLPNDSTVNRQVIFSPNSRYFAVTDNAIYQANPFAKLRDLLNNEFFVSFSPDGTYYASQIGANGIVEVRLTATGELIAQFFDPDRSIRFSATSQHVGVKGYSLYWLNRVDEYPFQMEDVGNFDFSADGLYNAIGSSGVYAASDSGGFLFPFDGSIPLFSPDGTLLAASDDALYTVPDGRPVIDLRGEPVDFSADGSVLATNYMGICLLYWAQDRPQFVGTLDLYNANVRSAPTLNATRIGGYSADGVTVIGRSADRQWYKILVGGYSVPSAWVSASAVTNVNVPETLPILES